jgi:hypothetical protein
VRMGQENARHADFQRHRHKSHDLGGREVTGGESRLPVAAGDGPEL